MKRVQKIGQFKRNLLYTAIATAMVGSVALPAYAEPTLEESKKPLFEGVMISPLPQGVQLRDVNANQFGSAAGAADVKSIEINGYPNLIESLDDFAPAAFQAPQQAATGINFALERQNFGLNFHGPSLKLSNGGSFKDNTGIIMRHISSGENTTNFKPRGNLFLNNFRLTVDALVAAESGGCKGNPAGTGRFLDWVSIDSTSALNVDTHNNGSVNAANVSIMGTVVGVDSRGKLDGSSVVFNAPESVYKTTNGALAHLHTDGVFYPLPDNGQFEAANPGDAIAVNEIKTVASRLFELGGDKEVKVQFGYAETPPSQHYDKLRVLSKSTNNTVDLIDSTAVIPVIENHGELTALVESWVQIHPGGGGAYAFGDAKFRSHKVDLRTGGITTAKCVAKQVDHEDHEDQLDQVKQSGQNPVNHASLLPIALYGEMEGQGNAAAPNVGILDIDKGHTAHLDIRSDTDYYSQAYVAAHNNEPTPNQVMVAGTLQGLVTGNNQLVLDGGGFQGFVVSSAGITHEFKDKSTIGAGIIDGSATYKGTVTITPANISYGDDQKALTEPLAFAIKNIFRGNPPASPAQQRALHAQRMRDAAHRASEAVRQAMQNVGRDAPNYQQLKDAAEAAQAQFDAANLASEAADAARGNARQKWTEGTTQLSGGHHVVEGNLVLKTEGANNVRLVGQDTTLDFTKKGSTLTVSLKDLHEPFMVVDAATLALSQNGTPLEVSTADLAEVVLLASNVMGNADSYKNIPLVELENNGTVTGKFQEKASIDFLYNLVIDASIPGQIIGKIEEEKNVSGAISQYTGKSGVATHILAKRLENIKTPVAGEKLSVFNETYAKEMKAPDAEEEGARDRATAAANEDTVPTFVDRKQKLLIAVEAAKAKGPQALARLADESVPQGLLNGANVRLSRNVVGEAHSNIVQRLNGGVMGASAVAAGDEFESQGAWAHYINVDGKQDDKDDIHGYDSKYNGITFGWDAGLNDGITSGFAFTYVKTDMDTKNIVQSTKGDHYMGAFYFGWNDGPWVANVILSYAQGKNDYKSYLSANGGSYKGDGDTETWAFTVGAAYNLPVDDKWTLQPKAEFNYVNVKVDDYDLTGSDPAFDTKVSTDDFDVVELGIGMRVVGDIAMDEGRLMPECRLMGYYDFKDNKYQGDVYSMAVTSHAEGIKRERARGVAGLGLSYVANENLSVGLDYDYHFQDDYRAHAIMAKITYDF